MAYVFVCICVMFICTLQRVYPTMFFSFFFRVHSINDVYPFCWRVANSKFTSKWKQMSCYFIMNLLNGSFYRTKLFIVNFVFKINANQNEGVECYQVDMACSIMFIRLALAIFCMCILVVFLRVCFFFSLSTLIQIR